MSQHNPFTNGQAIATLVKQLERRWGLTIISFLPRPAREYCFTIQKKLALCVDPNNRTQATLDRTYVDFYLPSQLHCTHLTLRRSSPAGPVRFDDFVRTGHQLDPLHDAICHVCPRISPISISFNKVTLSRDGLGIILLGSCVDDRSRDSRQTLLNHLNKHLPHHFALSKRKWDDDPHQYHRIHCCLGYLKRIGTVDYDALTDSIHEIEVESQEFELNTVTLVHHQYRSLVPPHEGEYQFTLGQECTGDSTRFADALHLE